MPKSSGALTVSVTVAEREFGGVAYAPLIVSVNVPVGVDVDVVTVSVEPPPARTAAGEKVPLAPAGRPASENVTVCALPDVTSVLTLYVVPSPRRMPLLDGVAAIEKSSTGRGVTVSETVVVCVVGGDE